VSRRECPRKDRTAEHSCESGIEMLLREKLGSYLTDAGGTLPKAIGWNNPPFRLRPEGHTSPGHSRDSPTLDRSSSVSKTTTFHFAASFASPRRRSVSLSSSASSEGDTPPTMIPFAPSLSAAQKAINTDCRLSGETSCETRNARSLERGIIVPAGSLASRGRLPKTSLEHLSPLFAGGSRLPRPWEKETTSLAR
jgi:hypothetical protein